MKKESKVGLLTLIAGSITNLGLGFIKLFIGLAGNSVSIISDGINNFGDVLACAGGGVGIATKDKLPTEKHPYGFKNAEHIATLIIAQIITVVGCLFTYLSIERLIYRRPVYFGWLYFFIILATCAVKLFMFIGYSFANKKVKSDILKCESLDSLLDSAITAVTLIGYTVSRFTGFPIDALVGISIGSVVLVSGIKILKSSASKLIGEKI